MTYGVGLNWHERYIPKLNRLYSEFLNRFDAVTVRDRCSLVMAEEIGVQTPDLTMCPSINLKEESFGCPKGMIAVCPRYEDWVSNDDQLDWLTNRLKEVEDEVLLIPFSPFNKEGVPVDLFLCVELKRRLKHATILNLQEGFSPRRVKYAISQSKLVISGGRYHAVVWAAAHNVPFEVSPTSYRYPKVVAFEGMFKEFGGEKLKEMEKQNKRTFENIMERTK